MVLAANVLITLALIDRDGGEGGYELAFHEPTVMAGSRSMVQPVDYGAGAHDTEVCA